MNASEFLSQFDSKPPAEVPAEGGPMSATDFLKSATPPGPKPPQMTGFMRELAFPASNVAEGFISTLGLPGDLASLGGKNSPKNMLTGREDEIPKISDAFLGSGLLLSAIKNKIQGKPQETPKQLLPTGEDLLKEPTEMGLTRNKRLAPQSEFEQLYGAGARGLGASIPFLMTGGAPAAVTLAGGTTSGVAGEAVHKALPDNWWAPMVAGALTGAGTAGLVTGIKNLIGRIQTGGIKGVAADLGMASTHQEGGEALQQRAYDWLNHDAPVREDIAHRAIDGVMQGVVTPLQKFYDTLEKISKKGGMLAPVMKDMNASQAPTIMKSMEKHGIASDVGGSSPLLAATPWEDVKEFRTSLWKDSNPGGLVRTQEQKNMERLYEALTEDMSAAAKANGVEKLFQKANEVSTYLNNFKKNVVSKITSLGNEAKESVRPEAAAEHFIAQAKKGGTDVAALRSEMPDAVNELASAHLLDPKGGEAGWRRLSAEGKQALVGSQEKVSALDSLVPSRAAKFDKAARDLASIKWEHRAHALGHMIAARFVNSDNPASVFTQNMIANGLGLVGSYIPGAMYAARGLPNLLANPRTGVMGAQAGRTGAQILTGADGNEWLKGP